MMLRRMVVTGVVCAGLAMVGGGVRGEMVATMPAVSQERDAAFFLMPYVDNQTLVAGHLDTAGVNVAAMEKYARELLAASGQDAKDMELQIVMTRNVLNRTLEQFKKAGGRHVYMVMSHPDIWPAMAPVAILIPLEPGGDAKAMTDLLKPLAAMGGLDVAMLKEGVMFVGHAGAMKRLKEIKPEARPDLLAAVSTDKDAPLSVGLALTPEVKRALSEMLPVMPAEIGGGSSDFLFQGISWVRVEARTDPAARLVIQMKTGDDAKRMVAFLEKGIELIRTDKDVVAGVKAQGLEKAFGELMDSMKPEVSNFYVSGGTIDLNHPAASDITITIKDKQLRLMAAQLAPAFATAQDHAGQAQSMSNIHQLLMGVAIYMGDHGGAMPDSLAVIMKENKMADAVGINPQDAKRRAYIYHPWTAEEMKKLGTHAWETPVIWEVTDEDDRRVGVGFVDGHVELMGSRGELEKRLLQAKVWAKGP